jgi:hypothetical protein
VLGGAVIPGTAQIVDQILCDACVAGVARRNRGIGDDLAVRVNAA